MTPELRQCRPLCCQLRDLQTRDSYPKIILAVYRKIGNGTFFFWIFRKCYYIIKYAKAAFQNYSTRLSLRWIQDTSKHVNMSISKPDFLIITIFSLDSMHSKSKNRINICILKVLADRLSLINIDVVNQYFEVTRKYGIFHV